MPFEEKAKYEKFLSQKIDDVLIKLLGPNQAKAIVETEMDFTKTEKVEYAKEEDKNKFKLDSQSGDTTGIEYLMPGFGLPINDSGKERSYNKQLIFPSNFIKKIKITVLVNKNMSDDVISSIKQMVAEIVSIKLERGDEIVILKSNFAPLWKTIWYNPESMSFVVKYIVLSILGIISLIIVAIGFLKLAASMNTMTKVQQMHQITMEMNNPSGQLFQGGIPNVSLDFNSKNKGEELKEEKQEEKIYFNIMLHQVNALVALMSKEDPANVAIVANHLRDNIKDEFIKRLPQEFAAEVIASLSKIRFVEQEVIYTLKDELENRLSGAMGGVEEAIGSFEKMDYILRGKMIKNLEAKYPEIAYEIKKKVLFFEDIFGLKEDELSILISSTNIDDWANIYALFDDSFREIFKKQLSDVAMKIIEEKNKYSSIPENKINDSIGNIMKSFVKLESEGRIVKNVKMGNLRLTNNNETSSQNMEG